MRGLLNAEVRHFMRMGGSTWIQQILPRKTNQHTHVPEKNLQWICVFVALTTNVLEQLRDRTIDIYQD